MTARILTLLCMFCVSSAYAHPNHQAQNLSADVDNLPHETTEEKHGHDEIAPCVEQHKALPCKKKR